MNREQTPRIFVFSTAYLPMVGGAEVAIHEIAKRIPEFRFFIFTARMKRSLPKEETMDGVRIIRLGFGFWFDKWMLPFLSCRRAQRMMRDDDAKVLLWGMMISQGTIGAYRLKRRHPELPFIVTLQEGDSDEHLERARFGLIQFYWRKILGTADRVTAISAYLAERAKKFGYQGEGVIIRNGVREEFFAAERTRFNIPGVAQGDYVVLSVSRLVEKNGLFDLLDGFAEFAVSEPRSKLVLVGDGPLRNDLERRIRALGIGDKVVMTGAVPHDDILRYYQSGDVFVRPSLSEGLGSVFLEAMATGLPVIAADAGGITEIVTHEANGLVVRTRDPHGVAAALARLRTNTDFAHALAREGRARIEMDYSWKHIASQMNAVFSDFLKNPS